MPRLIGFGELLEGGPVATLAAVWASLVALLMSNVMAVLGGLVVFVAMMMALRWARLWLGRMVHVRGELAANGARVRGLRMEYADETAAAVVSTFRSRLVPVEQRFSDDDEEVEQLRDLAPAWAGGGDDE